MNVEKMWTHIHDIISIAVDKFVPSKCFRTDNYQRRKAVWMNDKVMVILKKKKEAFQRYLSTKDGKDYLEYVKARNKAKPQVRRAVRDYEKDVVKKQRKILKHFTSLSTVN